MNSVCVLIPAYNEAKTVGAVIAEVLSQELRVYVVDDGSLDDTAVVAKNAGAVVIRNPQNMGKGASLREGFRRALSDKCDAVIIMDADGQHEARSIPDFVREMASSGADIVIGNRMSDPGPMPYVRRLTNRFMSWLISRMCGQKISDTQCGYKMIKRRVLEEVKTDSSNFEIESEFVIKASRLGFKITSVPIKAIYGDEKSKINPIIDTLRFIAFMIKMR
ncbi:MAG: glycosyltransferase family 2 protein [Candidatus Omnitrophica bacterium]|nr:glycosyltransferase family 2 protein [Candidatus Omnitrophota bacterium]